MTIALESPNRQTRFFSYELDDLLMSDGTHFYPEGEVVGCYNEPSPIVDCWRHIGYKINSLLIKWYGRID